VNVHALTSARLVNRDLGLHSKRSPNSAIAVTAIVGCQGDNRLCQGILVRSANGKFALCRSMLTENLAGAWLRDTKFLADMINTSTTTCGAEKFPRAASAIISLSSVKSDTARRKREFSFSSSFRRLAWLTLRPPYYLR
jgi:hypothetical protein